MVHCFVPYCNHFSEKNICKFFRFPAENSLKNRWIKNIRRADKIPNSNSRICSCHFVDSKKENNPTIFEWNKEKEFGFVSSEKKHRKKRLQLVPTETVTSTEETQQHPYEQCDYNCKNVVKKKKLYDPIVISDSDDSNSSIQCISDDEQQCTQSQVDKMPQIKLPIISSYGSIREGYMRDFFKNIYPLYGDHLMSIDLTSDDDDED